MKRSRRKLFAGYKFERLKMKRFLFKTILSFIIPILLVCNCSTMKQYIHRIKPYYFAEPRPGREIYTIFSDMHFFSPYALDMALTFEENTIFLGDIFDLKYAREILLPVVRDSIDQLMSRVGARYLPGNHELGAMQETDWIFIENGILFTHAHKSICWSDELVKKWEHELEEGKNTLGRTITKIEYFFWEKPSHTPKQKYIANALSLAAKYNCHTVVFGHTHIKRIFDQTYPNERGEAIRIINVPRGKTVIAL
jgi:predicted phosphodiesterase